MGASLRGRPLPEHLVPGSAGRTTPRCRTGWCTKGSPRSPWPSREGARHRAPSCTLLMSSWGFGTARKAVSQTLLPLKNKSIIMWGAQNQASTFPVALPTADLPADRAASPARPPQSPVTASGWEEALPSTLQRKSINEALASTSTLL